MAVKNCHSWLEALVHQFILNIEESLGPDFGSQHPWFTAGSDHSWLLSLGHWSTDGSSHLRLVIVMADCTPTDAARQWYHIKLFTASSVWVSATWHPFCGHAIIIRVTSRTISPKLTFQMASPKVLSKYIHISWTCCLCKASVGEFRIYCLYQWGYLRTVISNCGLKFISK